MEKLIIGLTGTFGSGCSHIAEKYLQYKHQFQYVSLSSILKELYTKENGESDSKVARHILQNYGNNLRNKHGGQYLATIAKEKIEGSSGDKWVIDSIKNPDEIEFLRAFFPKVYIFGITADKHLRWERTKVKYNHKQDDFNADEARDRDDKNIYGQRVSDCFCLADIIISNNIQYRDGSDKQREMENKIWSYLDLINNPGTRNPTPDETLMTIAYANSRRSSCIKRKVGAIIVDENGFLFSSGYNEVPMGELPCQNQHGNCYRNVIKDELSSVIRRNISNKSEQEIIHREVISKYKVLDYCRALHAEENAILNIARFGSSVAIEGGVLYTTTYPCNLCANKIAQVGLKEVVYFEPYPMEEAKQTLNSKGITQRAFEGVSFRGYFELLGEVCK